MKKLIVSLLLIGAAAIPASAASKMKAKHSANIDRSHDRAYSADWAGQATSPAPDADFTVGSGKAYRPYLMGQTMYYGLNNFTLYGATAASMNAQYQGAASPAWDGPAKNAYRNMRANNESEPLPANDGSRR